MSNLMQKIDGIFDDGLHDEKSKPQIKRSIAFVIAVAFLTLVTGTFTYSYLNRAVERMSILDVLGPLKYVIPAAGVVAFDLGTIFWSMVWRNNASNGAQSSIARVMFIVDVVGMTLTTLFHFVEQSAMPQILGDLTPFAVAVILVGNVVAYFEYENRADTVGLARHYREQHAILAKQRQTAEIELDRSEQHLRDRIVAGQKMLRLGELQSQLDEIMMQLGTQQGGRELLATDVKTLEDAKKSARRSMTDRFNQWRDETFGSAKPQPTATLASDVAQIKPAVDDERVKALEQELAALRARVPQTRGNGESPKA